MMQLPRWRVLVVLAATILGLAFSIPNVLPPSALAVLPGWMQAKRLNLGLDLQGGSSLLLEVDSDALAREKLTALTEDVGSTLRNKQIDFTGLAQVGGAVNVRIGNPAQYDEAYKELSGLARPLQVGVGNDMTVARAADQVIIITRSPDAIRAEASKAVQQSMEVVRRRIDELGTREPSITQQGSNRILVQAAGESDPEKLKALIGKTAKLTFQMVDENVTPEQVASGLVPPDDEVLPNEEGGALVVKKRALVNGEMLTQAGSATDQQTGQYVVTFRFNGVGTKRFGDATKANVGKRFAIVLDKKIISAPVINGPIMAGSGQITGNFTAESAHELSILLNAGALPTTLTVEEQRTVTAELGEDAVRAGAISTLVGLAAIVVFIVLAYGFVFGGIAVIGLILNVLLILAWMSLTQGVMTLPGIAGLILTLAVAVDANVLIYERIRDEERAGARPIMAIDSGFKRASVSIYDANITTLIVALIMFFKGTGPVKGFGLTLAVGVITSVFAAVFVGRVLVAIWFRAAKPKQLPI